MGYSVNDAVRPLLQKKSSPKRSRRSKTNLNQYTVKELKTLAKRRGLKGYSRLNKAELIDLIS